MLSPSASLKITLSKRWFSKFPLVLDMTVDGSDIIGKTIAKPAKYKEGSQTGEQ